MRAVIIALMVVISSYLCIQPGHAARRETPPDYPSAYYPRPRPVAGPSVVDRLEPYMYLWPYAAASLMLFGMLYVRYVVQIKVGALQGTAWELVRLMENTTPNSPRERARVAEATMEKFAVDGNSRIVRQTLIGSDTITTDLTSAGLNLMERHANDAAQFRAFRSSLRAGIAIFLSLMVYRNTQSSFVAMTEYMRRQRDRRDAPNFAELKTVFGLPTDWPTEDMPPLKRRPTNWDFFVIWRAIKSGRSKILMGLEYHPPTPEGRPPVVVTGDNILVAMRTYLHTSNTYPGA